MDIFSEEDRLSYRIIFLLTVLTLLAVPVTAVRLFAALVVLCFLPAAPLAARSGLSLTAAAGLTVTISPLMIALPVMLLMMLGLPLETSVWATVGIAMTQFLIYGTQRALFTVKSEKRLLILIGVILVVAAILTLWLPATNSWWRFRESNWFHAAVFNHLSGHGLPAVDPFFSPLRLQYMYFYHIFLLTASLLTGSGPFTAIILTNFIALLGCVLGFNMLAGMFTRSNLARTLGVVVCIFGMNGLFFLFFPIRLARAFLGETTGVEILRHFFTLSPLGHETARRFLSVEGGQHLFLDRFMMGTAFSLALGLVCVLLAVIVTSRRGRWTWMLSFFYTAALSGTLFLHLILGASVVVATAFVIVIMAIVDLREGDKGMRHIAWQALMTALAVAIAFPYIMSIVPGGIVGGPVRFALQAEQSLGFTACILPALIPALVYFGWKDRARREEWGLSGSSTLALWALIVLVIGLVVDLPTNNEIEISFPLHIVLSALAVGAFDLWLGAKSRRRANAVIIYVALCTIPLNAIYFTSAFFDRSEFQISGAESTTYDWIRKSTTEDALFLEADGIVRIPVLATRDLYWGAENYAENWAYPEAEINKRRALRDAVFGDGELPDDIFDHAALLGRPLFIVLRDIHADGGEKFQRLNEHPHLKGRHMYEGIAVFEVIF